MAVGILIILFVMAIFMPRSNLLYWMIMAYMWLLFSLNTGAPDTSTYEWIYTEGMTDAFEPVFTVLMLSCKIVGLSFVGFRMVEATLLLFFLNCTFRKIEQYKTLAAAMYMIAPFPWQVSGMRAALACVIIMYALTFLLDDFKRNVKNYCVFLLLATLVHYSSALFIIMLLAKRNITKKWMITFLAIAIVGSLLVQHSNILYNVVSCFTGREKIITWLSGGIGKEGYPNLTGFVAELFILFGNIYLTQRSRKIIHRNNIIGGKLKIANNICNFNIITILFIPFLRLNDTYMRLLLVIHGINVALYALTAFILQERQELEQGKTAGALLVHPRTRFSIYALIVPVWTYVIAFYQTLPYLGTTESVFKFLERNSMFP